MKQTTLRLPDELFDALVKEAESQDRSLNSVIHRRLRWVTPEILDAVDDGERVSLVNPTRATHAYGTNHTGIEASTSKCPHPKSRIVKGQCQACSEYVG